MLDRLFTNKLTIQKLFFIIANLFFVSYAFLALYYFKERCLYIDSAFQLFKIINFENFNIEASRYGVFFTQLLPLLAIKLGLPLKSILVIYSLSFVIVYYSVFLLCYFKLKEKTASFIIPVVLIIGISNGFFYLVTEIYQAIIFLIAFYAWISNRFVGVRTIKTKVFDISIAILLFLQCFFCHPTAVFPALFIIGYHVLYHKQFRKNELFILVPLIIIVAFVKIKLTQSGSYEGDLFKNFINSPSMLLNLFDSYPIQYFKNHIFYDIYLVHILLLAILVFFYIVKKRYLMLIYVVGGTFLFWCILAQTFYLGGDDIEIEKVFAPLALFLAIPVSKEIIFSNQKGKYIKSILFIGIIILGFSFIHKSGKYFETRVLYLGSLLNRTDSSVNKKFIIEQKELNEIIRAPWAVSVETLLLSTINSPDNQKTIYVTSNKQEFEKVNIELPDQFFLVPFWFKLDQPLNQRYFKLSPGPYTWINNSFFNSGKRYKVIKDYDFKTDENRIVLTDENKDSVNIGKNAIQIDENKEYALTYESKLTDISKEFNPSIEVKLRFFSRERLNAGDIFLVTTIDGIYYKSIDFSEYNIPGKWCNMTNLFETFSANNQDILKVYIWNKQKKNILVNSFSISIYE